MTNDEIATLADAADDYADKTLDQPGEYHPDWHKIRDEYFAKIVLNAVRWQPIETAPKDGTELLIWQDGEMFTASWRLYNGRLLGEWFTGFECAEDGRYSLSDPTHWMLLPAPPAL